MRGHINGRKGSRRKCVLVLQILIDSTVDANVRTNTCGSVGEMSVANERKQCTALAFLPLYENAKAKF